VNELKNVLIDYGLRLMQQATGVDPGLSSDTDWAGEFERRMGGRGNALVPSGPCQTIFPRLKIGEDELPLTYWMPRPLAIEGSDMDPQAAVAEKDNGRTTLGQQFAQAVASLDRSNPHAFVRFQHLMHLYASMLPNNHREAGSTLFQQWKAVAALAWIAGGTTGPPAKVLLVSGDLPGIQRAIYTISSKGAAKTLRGRSFFVQLLGDAAVRRLLDALGLCEANVVYDAGGNFLLVARAGQETVVRQVGEAVNRRLLEAFDGNLQLALACEEVEIQALFEPTAFLKAREKLGEALAIAKHRPFEAFVADWDSLWKPSGVGGTDHCAITGVELGKGQGVWLERTGEPGERQVLVTPLVKSLLDLAYDIRHERLQMTVIPERSAPGKAVLIDDGWDDVLAKISGYRYHFSALPGGWEKLSFSEDVLAYALNEPEAVQHGFHGFRFVANVTPTVKREDVAWWKSRYGDEDLPKPGDIRSFAMLANAAKEAGAIERVGVLRMDVDNLGMIFAGEATKLTMPLLSELSQVLERFFGGRLNAIVRKAAGNDAYVIYAGGDDLFIVAAWHLLPALAEAIRDAFRSCTGGHPNMTISGGITLEQPKFPIYRAARRAEKAEKKAKDFVRYRRMGDGRLKLDRDGKRQEAERKNAICFLGEVVSWDEWPLVRGQQQALLQLLESGPGEAKPLPKSILHVVQTLHRSYVDDLAATRKAYREQPKEQSRREGPDERQFFGRWRWMQAYALGRTAQRYPSREKDLRAIQRELLKPETIRLAGLAARWAEYRIRKED
jgi:CRISPR-associated protein Csm1